jgi:hypothetical protein
MFGEHNRFLQAILKAILKEAVLDCNRDGRERSAISRPLSAKALKVSG